MRMTALAIAMTCYLGPAFADMKQYTVPMNATSIIGHAGAFNADCSSMGETVMRVTTPPQHGTVSVKHGLFHSTFLASNPLSACNAKNLPHALLSYKPEKGFIGEDSVSYEIIFPDGRAKDNTVTVTVK